MHDPTQHGHSGGVTGSNIDTDHGLGMPHRDDTQRGNRDEGAIGQHQQKWAGATDFQSGRDGGFNADNRDQGVNERTQAPVGTTTSTHRHHDRDEENYDRSQAPFGHHQHRDSEALNADTRDQGMNERTRAPLGGVDNTTTSSHRHHDRDDEALNADTRDRGAHRHHDRDDEAMNVDNRDQGMNERTQAPIGGVDNTTTSTHRHHDRDNEALNADTRDRGAHDRTQAPVGSTDHTTTSAHRHPDRDVAMEERRDEDENDSPTGKKGPGKLDKLHGKFMVAKGKLTKDPEAIAQGERLQTEGVAVRASDFVDERRE